MATPLLPPSALSAMSAAETSAARTRAVAAKSHDGGVWHSPLPLPSPSLLPPLRKSLIRRLVVVLMPPPLILSTLPPPLLRPPSPLVCWRLPSRLSLVRRLVVASPVVACLCLASAFVAQLPHTSILDPSSLFAPADCCVASLRTASASRRAAASRLAMSSLSPMRRRLRRRRDCNCHPRRIPSSWRHRPHCHRRRRPSPLSSTSIDIVVAVISCHAVAMVIVVVDVARCAVAIVVNFAVRRAVVIVVVALLTSSSPVAPLQ